MNAEKHLQEMRLTRPAEGAVIEPIVPVNMRSLRGGVLQLLSDDEDRGGLVFEEAEQEIELMMARGESQEARARVEADLAGELTDKSAFARQITARALLMEGRIEDARAALGDAANDIRLALAQCGIALAEGDIARGRVAIDAAISRRPKGVPEHYSLALIFVAEGNYPGATEALGRVCASCESHAVARHQLGQLTQAAGDPARAGTLFEMAIDIAPAFVPPTVAMAEMLIESRQFLEAMNLLTAAIEHAPAALPPHLLRLRVLLEVGQTESALTLADQLRGAAPNNIEVLTLWAQAMLLAERSDEAYAAVKETADQQAGDTKAQLLRVLGRIDLSREPALTDRGIALLNEAIGIAANPAEIYLEVAQVQLTVGNAPEATLCFSRLAMARGADVNTLLTAALTARNHGLFPSAAKLGESAKALVRGTASEGQIEAFLGSLPQA